MRFFFRGASDINLPQLSSLGPLKPKHDHSLASPKSPTKVGEEDPLVCNRTNQPEDLAWCRPSANSHSPIAKLPFWCVLAWRPPAGASIIVRQFVRAAQCGANGVRNPACGTARTLWDLSRILFLTDHGGRSYVGLQLGHATLLQRCRHMVLSNAIFHLHGFRCARRLPRLGPGAHWRCVRVTSAGT